ncbi:MAG: histidinol dehydrogenase [Ruminococcaceae bacterium]|nr:histidinol dehydrogenase [Oscillospiraceae bacterium]
MIRIIRDSLTKRDEIFSVKEAKTDVSATVAEIIERVRREGDSALYYYTERFDRAHLSSLRVSEEEIREATEATDPELIRVLRLAAENITAFHKMQKTDGFELRPKDGVIIGQKVIPVDCAGLYVPGGTAAYPSTVLMDAIPAKLAGCPRVVMVTPPSKEGKVNPVILAAAHVAGVDEIYKVGGAQAIAALAYGTESIPKTDKIVGPGNAYVAEAKRQVYGTVSIDMIAGPSEIMVIADKDNRPCDIAADLLSQAEHDKMASAVLVTDSEWLAESVARELERQIPLLERSEIARISIDTNGKIIITDSLEEAVEIANGIAPEHLELCVKEPFLYLEKVRHAGSVFLGGYCPEALGDYLAGTNHTLPTSGTARFSSPLSVDDFVKKTQYIYYDKNALGEVARDVEYFAKKEGLTAHARSAVIRFEDEAEAK